MASQIRRERTNALYVSSASSFRSDSLLTAALRVEAALGV